MNRMTTPATATRGEARHDSRVRRLSAEGTSARRLRQALLALSVILSLALSVGHVAALDTPQVIILNSYHRGFAWSDAEESGFLERLREVYPEADVAIEFLDAKRDPTHENLMYMKDFLVRKYRDRRIDLLVVFDNPALDMLMSYRDDLFPGVPVVFAGISDFEQSMLTGRKRVTGVAEKQDVRNTLETALAIHPHAKEVLMIGDHTSSGLSASREIESLIPLFDGRIKIRFLEPVTFDEAQARISSLIPDTLVLVHSYATDRAGRTVSLHESTRMFAAVAKVPIYSVHETRLGHGIVGGYLLGGREHGRRAADLALRVAAGEDPDAIPVDTTSTARPMFDYIKLKQFGISSGDLPPGSVIVNKPESIFDKYRNLVIGTLIVVTILSVMVISLTVSIIRRKRAEEALRQANLVVENSPVMLFRWKAAEGWPVELVSQNIIQFGYSSEELLSGSRPFASMVHPDDLDRVGREVETFVSKDVGRFEQEYRIITKDGQVRWVDDRTVVERDAEGHVTHYQGIVVDITERKRAEESLKTSEERLRLALEGTSDGIWDWNLQTGQAYFSPHYFTMLGYEPGEFPGGYESWRRLLHPDDAEGAVEAVRNAIEKETPFAIEFRLKAKNGEWRWILGRGKVAEVDHEGKAFRMAGFHTDITERKRAEEEILRLNDELELRVLERTAQLEAANEELESFSYSVSHDLRAPLRAIDGYARILEEDYQALLDDEGSRVLDVVRSEARRMGHLIDHLLRFSRLSRQSLQKVETDMTALAREVFEELRQQEADRLVNLNLSPLPTVQADPTLLRQLWVNLFGNALKFTRGRESADIQVSGSLQGEEAIYFVKDNGAGFDMAYADKLFGVFQRLHGQDEFEGTGVGLALVQRIVHRHGGRTWAEGMLDHGASFYFSLPKTKEDSL
jgi:PAS domain S-box-containing protein